MNVYDKAQELTKALKESDEAQELQAALKAARQDPAAKGMMEGFRQKQSDLHQRMEQGEQPSPEDLEMMNKLREIVAANPLLQRTFDAERKFGAVFDDVTRIVTESLRDIMK